MRLESACFFARIASIYEVLSFLKTPLRISIALQMSVGIPVTWRMELDTLQVILLFSVFNRQMDHSHMILFYVHG